jgi:sec-independent protein translocase protein TatA
MFGDLSFSHILILLLVLVLVFGAKRIPEIGSSLGKGIKEFQRSLKDATSSNDQPPPSSASPPRAVQPPASSSPVSSGGDPKRLSD